ncbi:glycosyltransferase family 2 protein [Phenylobacterium sp.]|uniref:glycosyltransferase family 2 protein n=1 Tax=Phenylobacterium sp. TaxID=1871053 RepID=UPI00286C3671|nr:glycosyltransferase family 2 protein [Phenylobacterium sp.]
MADRTAGPRTTRPQIARPRAPAAHEDALILELEATRDRIQALEQEVALLKKVRHAQTTRLEAIARSTSWRVTRPLRLLIRVAKRQTTFGDIGHHLGLIFERRRPAGPGGAKSPGPPPTPQADPIRLESLAFPLPGAIAHLPELTGAAPELLLETVSVVIPTFNAGEEFNWLLRKLKAQKGLGGVEIVVVDSGSTDGTAELAERFGCTVVRIPNSEFSHSHARNLGADNAKGDLLLFTVQDAYPAGDHWLYSLALALTRQTAAGDRLAAVSCTEFPRRDSEIVYNAGIEAHYAFLGCRDADRIGALSGQDHQALRTQGQLSDVACMITAPMFQAYRYEGRYAEDLILGVRLIRDGHRIAMLSSVRVIHSHNRPAAYHLRRTFVDVLFLTDAFVDFSLPPASSIGGALAGAVALQAVIAAWSPQAGANAAESLRQLCLRLRRIPLRGLGAAKGLDFGVPALGLWIASAVAGEGHPGAADAHQVRTMCVDRIEGLADHVARVYGEADAYLVGELKYAVGKTLAATLGAQLAFYYLNHALADEPADAQRLADLRALMLAGI